MLATEFNWAIELATSLRYKAREETLEYGQRHMGSAMAGANTVTPDALSRTTAPSLLCELARSAPDRIAFRSKHLGIYRERTWRDHALLVARTAKAFADYAEYCYGLGFRAFTSCCR